MVRHKAIRSLIPDTIAAVPPDLPHVPGHDVMSRQLADGRWAARIWRGQAASQDYVADLAAEDAAGLEAAVRVWMRGRGM